MPGTQPDTKQPNEDEMVIIVNPDGTIDIDNEVSEEMEEEYERLING